LFGDITGSSALIFGSRTLVTSSHSREAETNADGFAIDVMHRLGRPAKPTGELLLRVTGKESKGLSIISSHPLSEDRLARMGREDRQAGGPPLLTSEEWRSLKSICDGNPDSGRSNPGKSNPGKSGPAKSGPAKSDPGPAKSGPTKS
jgi:predicted Zn-dependent protease